VADFIDVHERDVSEGCSAHLGALVMRIDADLVASMATGPELWRLARELRAEADARVAEIETERLALAAARAASPARVLAAMRWRRSAWLDEFRPREVGHV
jgi:hypothetical protein